jgi:hypothetical protein
MANANYFPNQIRFMKKILLGLFSLSLLATACKKGKDAPAPTKENLAGQYKLTAMIEKSPGMQDVDLYATHTDACDKDNITELKTDGTYTYSDVGVVCEPADDNQGIWSVSGNTITFDEYPVTISKFDGSTLEITDTYVVDSVTYTDITTYKKQ